MWVKRDWMLRNYRKLQATFSSHDVCVRMCVTEREREKEREKGRQGGRKKGELVRLSGGV